MHFTFCCRQFLALIVLALLANCYRFLARIKRLLPLFWTFWVCQMYATRPNKKGVSSVLTHHPLLLSKFVPLVALRSLSCLHFPAAIIDCRCLWIQPGCRHLHSCSSDQLEVNHWLFSTSLSAEQTQAMLARKVQLSTQPGYRQL